MKKKGSFGRLLSFTENCRGKIALAVLLAVLGVLCGMIPYFAVAGILTAIVRHTLTAGQGFAYVGAAAAGELARMLLTTCSSARAHETAYRILCNIRCRLAEKMMRLPMGVLVDTPSGQLKAMIVDTVEKLEKPLAHMLPEITANLFTPVCIIGLLFGLDWRMALACLAVIPVGMLLLMGQMKDYRARSKRYMKASADMDSSVVETVNGIQVIKAFSQTEKAFRRFSEAVRYYHDTTLDWWKNTWIYSALGLTVIPAVLLGGIPAGACLMMRDTLEFPVFLTCLILSLGIAGPLIQASYYVDSLAVVDASIRQIGDFLDQPELQRPRARAVLRDEGFSLQKVRFSYGQQEVLHEVSFSPVAGSKTAIVGPSGSGKSTVTKLMAGFWDVTGGSITYGGKDLREIPISQLMEHISFVTQDNFLFNMSIRENIRMGNPDADDEAVEAAAKAACCDGFIRALPRGYDTLVGDAGGRLSGGERQRIAVARAMLKQADVIILDEASAHADPENEVYMEQAIAELTKGKTLIVVAHRLQTIVNSDRILVLDQGRLAGSGTHAELLAGCPLYRKMWEESTEGGEQHD